MNNNNYFENLENEARELLAEIVAFNNSDPYEDEKALHMMFASPICIVEKPDELYIDLEQLLKYGTIHGVRRFSSISELTAVLPTPEAIEYYGTDDYDICYGEIIFVMENERLDRMEIPLDEGFIIGSESTNVDFWEFEDCDEITLFTVESVLTNECISFNVEFDPYNSEIVELKIPQSNVILTFHAGEQDDPCDYELAFITA